MRNGMSAAATAGGVLAVVVPAVAVATPAPTTGGDAAEVRLASDADRDAQVRMIASIVPVDSAPDPEPPEVDVGDLLKAAGLADVARQAEELRAAREAAAHCDADLDGLGRVKPWVRAAARFLSCLYDEPTLIGVSRRSRHSDHPSGHAVDLMVRGERGDRIAECALANREELGISYVIWEQRVNHGDGWERMEDRGGDTENHVDHVHISFERSSPDGVPDASRCK
ncbi:hypothetical protein BJF78_08295 [Pseudonocardia sp. CNS-139]|nr:hypothetical protein BJF78_08295 [Pseudonocardia sp. CNS-139]